MKMQYLESLQAFVTTEIRIWDPSQPTIMDPTHNENPMVAIMVGV